MKKSSFIAQVLGTVSGMLFALGMCMALIPEWNAFRPGVIFGAVGLVLGAVTVAVWRKLEGKAPIRVSGKNLLSVAVGILGALLLGVGMCFCMVRGKMLPGILIGMAGIALLLCLIPLIKGIHD